MGSSLSPAVVSSAPPVLRPVQFPGSPTSPPPPAGFPPIADAACLLPRRSGLLPRSPTLAGRPSRSRRCEIDRRLPPSLESRGPPPSPPTAPWPGTRILLAPYGVSLLPDSFLVLLPPAIQSPPEPVRIAAGFDDMRLVRQPVQHGFAQPRVREDRRPLGEGQVRGYDHGRLFRPPGDHLEQHLGPCLRQGHIPHLVDDQQFVPRPTRRHAAQFVVVPGLHQFVDHLRGGREADPLALPAGRHR